MEVMAARNQRTRNTQHMGVATRYPGSKLHPRRKHHPHVSVSAPVQLAGWGVPTGKAFDLAPGCAPAWVRVWGLWKPRESTSKPHHGEEKSGNARFRGGKGATRQKTKVKRGSRGLGGSGGGYPPFAGCADPPLWGGATLRIKIHLKSDFSKIFIFLTELTIFDHSDQ